MFALIQVALAGCQPTDLDAALTHGEQAFEAKDTEALESSIKQAKKATGCAQPNATSAARYHRLSAYYAGLTREWDVAEDAWRASLAAQPLLPSTPDLVKNQRLFLAWKRAQERPIVWKVAKPAVVNGTYTPLRPDTTLMPSAKSTGLGLKIAGIGLGLVAGGLYAGSWAARSEYDKSSDQPTKDRMPLYYATNGLAVGALGTAVLGSGLLIAGFIK